MGWLTLASGAGCHCVTVPRDGREQQGGREGQLWEICLKQPPKLVQEQLQPVLVGVWGVDDALAQGSSTQYHAGLRRRPRQEQGHAGREDAAAAAPPAGIFFAFPNGSFLRQPPPPTAGSTWLQCWLGSCRRLWLGGAGAALGYSCAGWGPHASLRTWSWLGLAASARAVLGSAATPA